MIDLAGLNRVLRFITLCLAAVGFMIFITLAFVAAVHDSWSEAVYWGGLAVLCPAWFCLLDSIATRMSAWETRIREREGRQ